MATIGHNNPPPSIGERFKAAMEKLRALGLKGEIALTGGLVMVSTTDKASSRVFRSAIKSSAKKAGVVSVETRPAKGSYVFTIICG